MSPRRAGEHPYSREDEPGRSQPLPRSIVIGTVVIVAILAGSWLLSGQDGRPGDGAARTGPAAQRPEGVPASCRLTVPDDGFEPPDDYRNGSGARPERTWYGDLDLWTALSRSGETIEPDDQGRFGARVFVWSTHQAPPREEPNPDLTITARPVGSDGPVVRNDRATNGFSGTNIFMITSLELPGPGCWQVTAEYRGHRLSWTIWAGSSEGRSDGDPRRGGRRVPDRDASGR